MKWEVKEQENGKWGIYLCEEFWKYPDKPVCYGESVNRESADTRVKWMNDSQAALEERENEMGRVETDAL